MTIWSDGHGKVHGRFTVDTVTGAMLKKALLAFAAPKHQASQGPLGERRPTPERLGRAFAELIQRYPVDQLPKAGGLTATVVCLIPLETLLGGLKAAKLDTGEPLSPGAARRLACEAGIIPAVLGGKSEVLDLGRSRRFHSPAQRVVATIEQAGCSAEGCDWHPACATSTTRSVGPTADPPTVTRSCSAPPTTHEPTTSTTRCPAPRPARTPSTGGRKPCRHSQNQP